MDNEFNKLVEQFMLMDKMTLAQLLAFKELANRQDVPVIPTYPAVPSIPWPCPNPWWPNTPGDGPWWPQFWYTNTSNGKEYENYTFKRDDVVEDTNTDDYIRKRFKDFN